MLIRRLLLIAPAIVCAILLQSAFWVPSYEDQVKGNPGRLTRFITASIGDAHILNPILNSDTASSSICNLIFEGLLDRDENLHLRGRLAESWTVTEKAYFYVNEEQSIADGSRLEISQLVKRLRKLVGERDELSAIKDVRLIPARSAEIIHAADRLHVNYPPRVELVLDRVDQDIFDKLEAALLGRDYFDSFDPSRYISPGEGALDRVAASLLLPASEHNPIVEFRLRRGVLFHDGHEFDSGDVAFTYRAIIDPRNRSPRAADYEPVKEIHTPDRYHVVVVYKRLFSPALSSWGMGMLPEHLLNDKALRDEAISRSMDAENFTMRDSEFNRKRPIGCGPFVFVEWQSDEFIRLRRFENYWEGAPHYREYIFRVVPDLVTQEMEFRAGTVDDYSALPYQVAKLKENPAYQNFSGLSFGYSYIGYNMRRELFQDARVRCALGMAINIEEIIEYLRYGQAEPITGPFPMQTDYYDKAIKLLPYDLEGAARLLEEAGWKKGADGILRKEGKAFRFALITNSGNQEREAILVIAQNAWKKLGIDVSVDRVEWSVFLEKYVDVGNFDAVILGWSMGIDPDLYQIWHSSQSGDYQLNFVAYKNPEADELIIKIRQEYDEAKQTEYCHRLHRIIHEDQPYTFLFVGRWTAVLDRKIVIMEEGQDGKPVYKKITPTPTGSYIFHFNKWIKLPHAPEFLER